MVVKVPPARIFPSACTRIDSTVPFAFGSNNGSAEPVVGSSRAILKRVAPPIVANSPTAKILPSAWTMIAVTKSDAFGLNESADPVVGSSRAM